VIVQMDNSVCYNGRKIQEYFARKKMTKTTHPVYCPDLSPCDFWFFCYAKELIVGGSSVIASLFRNQSFIERPAAKPVPTIPMLADKVSAREFLRQFITQNVANPRQRELALAGAGAMSVNDTYRLRDSLSSYLLQHTPQSILNFMLQQTPQSILNFMLQQTS
jgi:hypothetical protein